MTVTRQIIDAIVADLSDRRGLKNEWDQIDPPTRREILASWGSIVTDAINEHDLAVTTAERSYIRRRLWDWLVGGIDPKDAGLVNGRRITDEIDRICPPGNAEAE